MVQAALHPQASSAPSVNPSWVVWRLQVPTSLPALCAPVLKHHLAIPVPGSTSTLWLHCTPGPGELSCLGPGLRKPWQEEAVGLHGSHLPPWYSSSSARVCVWQCGFHPEEQGLGRARSPGPQHPTDNSGSPTRAPPASACCLSPCTLPGCRGSGVCRWAAAHLPAEVDF